MFCHEGYILLVQNSNVSSNIWSRAVFVGGSTSLYEMADPHQEVQNFSRVSFNLHIMFLDCNNVIFHPRTEVPRMPSVRNLTNTTLFWSTLFPTMCIIVKSWTFLEYVDVSTGKSIHLAPYWQRSPWQPLAALDMTSDLTFLSSQWSRWVVQLKTGLVSAYILYMYVLTVEVLCCQ